MSRSGKPITMRGRSEMVVSGHPLATLAGYDALRRGGNAIDALVAAGTCLSVVHFDMTTFGGVAPIMLYLAGQRRVVSVAGVGTWPELASLEYFLDNHDGKYPPGMTHSIVPAAPAAWSWVLSRYGTMSFEQVTGDALRCAAEGFPLTEFQCLNIANREAAYRYWPQNEALFLPDGKPPQPGRPVVQPALARVIEGMLAAESEVAHRGREVGIRAARDYFYRGPVADEIDRFSREQGGFIRKADLEGYEVREEPAVVAGFEGYEVFICGPWSQGPVLAETLRLLDCDLLAGMELNSPEYIHTVTEALKLAFADREAYCADPLFVDVPLDTMLSEQYIQRRRLMIDPNRAAPGMPSPGDVGRAPGRGPVRSGSGGLEPLDTSVLCVVDRFGNMAASTQSDECTTFLSPIVPTLGFPVSPRGAQSRLDPLDPNCVAAKKRPRLTPNPALILKDGHAYGTLVTPGADAQCQSMAQVLFNHIKFGMDPQSAVESPRFLTASVPGSFYPFTYEPGVLRLEGRIPDDVGACLAQLGHQVEYWPDWSWKAGGVCLITIDRQRGVIEAGADPRRASYAAGR